MRFFAYKKQIYLRAHVRVRDRERPVYAFIKCSNVYVLLQSIEQKEHNDSVQYYVFYTVIIRIRVVVLLIIVATINYYPTNILLL